jgi:hypothetical protein
MADTFYKIEIVQTVPNTLEIQETNSSPIIQFEKSDPKYSYDILNFDDAVNQLIKIKDLTEGDFVYLTESSGNYTISVSGLSLENHTHSSSEITDFVSSVSGLLPVTDIFGGANISITSSGSLYTISVSGQLGLTAEQVDDRVNELLIAGQNITLSYNDNLNTLTISTTGLQPSGNYSVVGHSHVIADVSGLQIALDNKQPSGNYSIVGHTHTSNSVTDFNNSVSGLLPIVSGNGYAITSFENNVYTISVTGLQPSGDYSIVGHTHSSSNITDFNSSVSGLLPVTDLIGGSYINMVQSGTIYTVSVTGLQPSGNYSTIGHSHVASDISDFNSSVSGLLLVDIVTGTGIVNHIAYWNSSSGIIADSGQLVWDTNNRLGIGINNPEYSLDVNGDIRIPLDKKLVLGNEYEWDFFDNSALKTGAGKPYLIDIAGGLVIKASRDEFDGEEYDTPNDGIIFKTGEEEGTERMRINLEGNVGIGTNNPSYTLDVNGSGNFSSGLFVSGIPVSVSGHSHSSNDITDFDTAVSGLLPNVNGSGFVNSSFSNNTYTISVTGVAASEHNHSYLDINDLVFDNNDFINNSGSISINISGVDNNQLKYSYINIGSSTVQLGESISIFSGIVLDGGSP